MMSSLNIKQLKYCRVKLGLRSVSNFGESESIVEYTAARRPSGLVGKLHIC